MILRPGNPILFALCVILIFAAGVGDDMRSCQRSTAVRAPNRAYFAGVARRALLRAEVEQGVVRRLDVQTYRAALAVARANHPLDCSLPAPETH